jgi:hypothetical protein
MIAPQSAFQAFEASYIHAAMLAEVPADLAGGEVPEETVVQI